MEAISFNELESLKLNFRNSTFYKSVIKNINFDLNEFDDFFEFFFFQEGEIRVFKNGVPIDPNTYIKPKIKGNYAFREIIKGDVINLLDEGCTLIFEALNEKNSFFNSINAAFEQITQCRCWINGYLTPSHSTGFKSHADQHDVIIVQLMGSKKWSVEATQFIINPFDIVYIPKGIFHNATTNSDYSFHITIGVDRNISSLPKHFSLMRYCFNYGNKIENNYISLKEIPLVSELDDSIELAFTNHSISFPMSYFSFISELIHKEIVDVNNTDSLLELKSKEKIIRILYRKGLLEKKTAPNSGLA